MKKKKVKCPECKGRSPYSAMGGAFGGFSFYMPCKKCFPNEKPKVSFKKL